MRRADRLFEIIQLLRTERLSTAKRLAEHLHVSERTIYRDVQDLVQSGVPIEGEAGVGYMLRNFDLPPLMFAEEELEALVLGIRFVESWADAELARAAKSALSKIQTSLPVDKLEYMKSSRLFAPDYVTKPIEIDVPALRHAVRERRKVRVAYRDVEGVHTERTLRPLSLYCFSPVWLLIAWCDLRDDFRTFRLDRMQALVVEDSSFADEPGKTLKDWVARMQAEEG